MAANRYGQIWHGDHHHINIRFPSNEARLKFQEEFEAYHQSHDHDGDVPIFKAVTTKELKLGTGSRTPQDTSKTDITIDGYHWTEIRSYQDNQDLSDYNWYRLPTCCVPPIIVIDSKYVNSADLKRHPLSAIFGDMSDSDFQSLLGSVASDGFIDPVIRIYEGQILDGWHRYRAAQELGIIRKLRFREWHEDEHRDGDPKAFVLARNIERRHLSASQRAQIVVSFNERFGMGRPSEESPSNDGLKSRNELAKEAGVGVATIDRAVAVEKEGESEAVIAGEKTAGEVLLEKQKKRKAKAIWDTRREVVKDWAGEEDNDLNQHLSLPDLEEGFIANNPAYADHFEAAMDRTSFPDFNAMWNDIVQTDVELDDLEAEHRAMLTYSGDVLRWQRPDWSPDTNWILPLIAAKMAKKLEATAEPEPEPDLKTLREQVKKQIPKYKEWYKGTSYKEYELIAHASFSHFIEAYRSYRKSEVKGAATVEELKDLLGLLKSKSYPFSRHLRKIRVGLTESGESDGDTDRSLNDRMDWCRADLTEVYQQMYTWEGLETHLYAEEYGIGEAVISVMQKEIAEAHPKPILENTMDEMPAVAKFDAKLKAFGAHEDLVCDTLHFHYGIERADLSEASQETLINISKFIESFIDKPLEEWPLWIRNQVPKRELVLVSIGISRDDDEFELVEFTDENSDEVWCKLGELPADLKDALFDLAVKKIVENEVIPIE